MVNGSNLTSQSSCYVTERINVSTRFIFIRFKTCEFFSKHRHGVCKGRQYAAVLLPLNNIFHNTEYIPRAFLKKSTPAVKLNFIFRIVIYNFVCEIYRLLPVSFYYFGVRKQSILICRHTTKYVVILNLYFKLN